MSKNKGSKKERKARQKILDKPWWKFKENWFFLGAFVVIVLIVGVAAIS